MDPKTIRLIGEVIPHGHDRRGHPIISNYEKAKKDKKSRKEASSYWVNEVEVSGMSKTQLIEKANATSLDIKAIERALGPLRKTVSDKHNAQSKASRELTDCPDSYDCLWKARRELRSARNDLSPLEAEYARLKQDIYSLNRMVKCSGTSSGSNLTPNRKTFTKPTWDWPKAEDKTEKLDLTSILSGTQSRGRIVYSGTDYGLHVMSETVALSEHDVRTHFNYYWSLTGKYKQNIPTP